MYRRNLFLIVHGTYLQAALKFFEELTQSMGRDVKFRFRNVYESGTSRAGATWHLGTSIYH